MSHNYYFQTRLNKFSSVNLFAIFFVFFQPLSAKDKINTSGKPEWVEEVTLKSESILKSEDISDGYLYQLRDYQFHVEKKTSYYHYVKKIYSSIGVQKGSEIEVSYDPTYEKVIFHEIKIIRDGEVINKLDPGKFKIIQREQSKESYIYDGSLSAVLILEDVRAGDFIEYSFSRVGRNPIYAEKFFTSFYLAFYDPLDRLFIKIITPKARLLHIKNDQSTYNPSFTEEGIYKVYRWDLEHIPGITVDTGVPYWYSAYPFVGVSEFSSWKEVKDWAVNLYTHPAKPGNKLQQAIASIQSSDLLAEKRLESALSIVQNEVRYTGLESGIGGYKPRNPSEVFEQKFGDCKDKSLLLCYMLNQMGIEAYPALVNTSSRQEIKKWLPSPVAFDHCIVRVQLSGKTYWYDPTLTNQGGTYDHIYFPNYKYALVIGDDTKDLTEIPVTNNSKIKVIEDFMINNIGGSVEVSITTAYSGFDADEQRYYFSNNNLKEIEKNYLNYNAKNYAEIEVAKPLVTSDDKYTNVFTTYETYKINNFWYAPDSTMPGNVECVTYPQTLRDKIVIPERPIRTMPVGVDYPLVYEHTVNLFLPEPWTIPEEDVEIKSAATYFKRTTSYENDVITLNYVYKTLKNHIDAKETAAFIKKQTQVANQLGYSLTYNKQVLSTAPVAINWLMVLLTLIFIGISAFSVYKIYQYDPAPNELYSFNRPAEIGGWLYLIAFGLCASPLYSLVTIFNNDYYNLTTWNTITDPNATTYNIKLAVLIVAEVFYNIFFLAYSILLIVVFFKRRSSFPLLMSIRYGGSILFIALEIYILYEMKLLAVKDNEENIKELVKLIISGAIWIPYLYLSERSKETFLNRLTIPENIQQVYKLKV